MAADTAAVTANGADPSSEEVSPLVPPERVIRVSAKHDNWRDLGTRLAFESCGTGVAMMRGIGAAAVYVMAQAFIHARSITALRGLDLQATLGWQNVETETRSEPIHAVVLYAFARKPDQMAWEDYPDG